MAYRDVITFWRLEQANTGKTVDDLNEIGEEAEAVIEGVSSLMRSRLSRALIVEPVTQRTARHHWTEDETAPAIQYRTWADEQPIVQVQTDGIEGQGERRLVSPSEHVGAIEYFAGWRRPDQVLSGAEGRENALPTGDGEALEGLSALPGVLPAAIREVAVNLCLHVLSKRGKNLGERSTRTIGGQEMVVEGADPGFIERQMSRLSEYDRSQML